MTQNFHSVAYVSSDWPTSLCCTWIHAEDAGAHFLFCFTTEVTLLCFSEIPWCCYPDAETPAEMIKVLSNIQILTERTCWKQTFHAVLLETFLQHADAISIQKWHFKKNFFYQYALRLSVLNNELFCQKHLLSGRVGLLCFSPGFSDLCNRRYNGCCQNCVVITGCVYQALNARPLKEMSRTLMSSRSIRCSQTSNWVSHWKAWRRKEILYPNRMQTCNRRFWFDCSSHFGTT